MDRDPDDFASRVEKFADDVKSRRDFDERPSSGVHSLLRLTERYAIPAAISALKATVRLLELSAEAIRLANEELEAEDTRARTNDVTLDKVDSVLEEFEEALRGEPTDPDARRLLTEARDLRTEIRDRIDTSRADQIGESANEEANSYNVPIREESDGECDERDTPEQGTVDVEAELESIRHDLNVPDPEYVDDAEQAELDGDEEGTSDGLNASDGDTDDSNTDDASNGDGSPDKADGRD